MRTCALLLLVASVIAGEASGFLRDGDVWVFHGDSITHADTYRRACERVFRHLHPEAKVEFVQAGVWGSSSSDLVKRIREEGRKPTVVSLMLGMNNAINGAWVKGQPREAPLAAYRKDMVDFVRKFKADGAAVVLMSPTLADETCRRTFFRIDGANEFLRDCGRMVREVAEAEGAVYVPVQEEFEAFQETLDRRQKLRPDGVHPASLGEYQIARSLWHHLAFAAPLAPAGGERRSVPTAPPAAVLAMGRFAGTAAAVTGTMAAPAALTWSLGGQRGTQDAAATWSIPVVETLGKAQPGALVEGVVAVGQGEKASIHLLDLCPVPVLHLKDGACSSTMAAADGRRLGTWMVARDGAGLRIEVEVDDAKIASDNAWAFARDGLCLWFDLRNADRLGGINLDTDVHQAFVNVYDKPLPTAMFRPWLGDGLDRTAVAGMTRTATGYRVILQLQGDLTIRDKLAMDKREAIGLSLGITGADAGSGEMQTAAQPRDQYASTLPVIDLSGRIPGDIQVNTSIFPSVR
jgi:lysophospholipase L1-like esterase